MRSRRTAPSLAVLLGDTTAPDACRLLTALEVEGEVIAIEPATLGSLEVRTHGSRADARLGGVTLQPDAVLVWRLPQTCEHPRRADLLADPVARSYHVRQWTTMLRGLLLAWEVAGVPIVRSEEHTSELQSPFLNSYAVFCLKKKDAARRISQVGFARCCCAVAPRCSHVASVCSRLVPLPDW